MWLASDSRRGFQTNESQCAVLTTITGGSYKSPSIDNRRSFPEVALIRVRKFRFESKI